MNRKGQDLTVNTMMLAVIGMFVVIVGVTIVSQWSQRAGTVVGKSWLQDQFKLCQLDFKKYEQDKTLNLDQFDSDRDKCRNAIDMCSFTEKELISKKYITQDDWDAITNPNHKLALLGNDYMDTDNDGISDVCDTELGNPGVGCIIEKGAAGRERCVSGKDIFQKAKIHITSSGTAKEALALVAGFKRK